LAWREVREAFEALLGLAPAERAARLAEIERAAPELATELRELLEHDSAAQSDGAFLSPAAARAPAPARIGPWELVRELGRGGMGIVYLARRADGAFERRAALKLLHAGQDDARVLERFRRERQVLANLDHPGIARLIEGGQSPDGRPYLVMDHVEGSPIDRWCDDERLDVRARIALFLAVCDAVQHAHEHLVVHRDLKPRNILVTPQGRPVLLDFGIAKVLDREKASAAPEVTLGFAHFLTPAYASPEQVAGRPITTASDVYSLGVVLYQLLTGELPYSVATTSAAEIERIVCEVEPGRPSESARGGQDPEQRARARGTTPAALARALSGDLDRVVLKALRKETRQRYASVEALAEDLRRQQAGLPVRARADTLGYRASRFVARHRAGVALGTLVLATLVAALAVSTAQYRRAQAAGELEAEQRERAERGLEVAQRLAGDLATEREAAVGRVAEVERLNAELETQRALAQRRFDDVRGFATGLIFELYGRLHPLEGSTPAIEVVIGQGLEHLDRLAAEAGDDLDLKRELAHAYMRMAAVQGGWSNNPNHGHLDDALVTSARASALAEELVAASSDDLRNVYTLVATLSARASLLWTTGREQEALDLLERALEEGQALADPERTNLGQAYALFFARSVRAHIGLERLPPAESRAEFRALEATLAEIVARFRRPDYEFELAALRGQVAELDYRVDGGVEPVERLAANLAQLEQLAGGEPDDQFVARAARTVRAALAACLTTEGDHEGALELLERNRAEIASRLEADAADVQSQQDALELTNARIELLLRLGRAREALLEGEPLLAPARARAERSPSDARARIQLARLARGLASCRLELGLALDAGQGLVEARETLRGLIAAHPDLVPAQVELARVLAHAGRAQLDAARRSSGDPALERHALEQAAGSLSEALELARGLERAGVPGVDPTAAALERDLGEARSAQARL
jgi:tetratricopeptide (TPR) repeat protein